MESHTSQADESGPLGRVLIERESWSAGRRLQSLLVPPLAFVGVFYLVVVPDPNLPFGLSFIVGAVLCYVWGRMSIGVFRCCEQGVQHTGRFGVRELRWTEIGTFTYSAARVYRTDNDMGKYVDTYQWTRLALRFSPLPEVGGGAISYSDQSRQEDSDLNGLRDFVAGQIGTCMAARLAEGEVVPWTPNLTFTPEGIEFRPRGLLGRKEFELLPYADFAGHEMALGVLYLFRRGEEKPIMSEVSSAPNFFPGHFLLKSMQRSAGRSV